MYPLPGHPDIVFIGRKVAVFVDSCFWHGCAMHCRMPHSNVDYWVSKIGNNKQRDIRINDTLHSHGWLVIRVWEHDIRADIAGCVERVSNALIERAEYKNCLNS